MERRVEGAGVEATVRREADGRVRIQGRILALGTTPQSIAWSAAAPPSRGIGFAGAAQPYPNRDIALSRTPNRGTLDSPDGTFVIELVGMPAGYYTSLGTVYVPPVLELASRTKSDGAVWHGMLQLDETAAPFRWIAGAPATLKPAAAEPDATGRAMYYFGREQLPHFPNQEALLRARAYPTEAAARGWSDAVDASPWATTPAPS
jgi:hypothetical protein